MMKNIVALLLIAVALIFLYVNFSDYLPWTGGDGEQEIELTEDIDLIKIDLSSVNAQIIPTDSAILTAEATGKKKIDLSERRGTVDLKVTQPRFNLFSFDFSRDDVMIYLPLQYKRDIEIDIGSGSLTTEDFDRDQPLTLSSFSMNVGSGKSTLGNVTTKSFSYNGSSGNITFNALTTEKGEFDVSSGSIELHSYSGPLNASISSGSLTAQFEELTDSIDVSISSGNVNLDLPDDADFTLNGKTSYGSISSSLPLENHEVNKREISGVHGEGTHQIDLKVSSGNITIY